MSSYYNIDELNATIENSFTIACGLLFQKACNMDRKFSTHLIVPIMTHLVPLFVWYTMVSHQGNLPSGRACLEQLVATVAKLIVLYFIVKKYEDNEEIIAVAFLIVTNVGMLYPKLFSHDDVYHIHLRFFEDTVMLNMVSQFFHLRSLQQADSKNVHELESNALII